MAEAAVIIPHYNDAARLARCLAALVPQVTAETEVVVVDHASTQPLDGLLVNYPCLRLVTEPARGAAMARNRGVAETTAPLLFFLDCDCVPAPDWLATAFRGAEAADLVGGRIDVFDETPGPRNGAQAFEAVFAFDNRAYVEVKGFSVTANLVTRRDVFATTGPFMHGVSEDLDWCHRATTKGFRLAYADDLRVSHPSRGNWVALEKEWRRLTDEGFGVNGSSPAARARWALKALAMPLSIPAHAPRILTSSSLKGADERLAALGVLVRLRITRADWMLRQAAGRQI